MVKSVPFENSFGKDFDIIMDIKNFWNKKEWKTAPEYYATVSALVYGMLVHLFALTNMIHNHDNIASQPGGYGMGIELGRWFLEFLGRFCDKAGLNYNVPSINGMVYIAILAVTAGFLVSALRIKNKLSAILVGALFVAFPTVTVAMAFRFTAVFYGISTLFAVLAAWVLRRSRWGLPASVILMALSMGIYQAYIPITISIFVLQLICEGLRKEADAKTLIFHGLYDCLALLLGLALYFLCVNITVAITGDTFNASENLGMSSLSQLPLVVGNALRAVCMLPLQDYLGVANRALMRISYLLLALCTAPLVVKMILKVVRNTASSVIICLLCPVFLLAVGFIEVMIDSKEIYTLMVYSFCLLACAPLAIVECIPPEEQQQKTEALFRNAISFLVAVLVGFYGYYANVNYAAAYFAGEQIDNYLSGVVLRTTMTEGFTTDKQWALLGDIQDPLLGGVWNDEISYIGFWFTEHELNEYSRKDWIENYIGYDLPFADAQTVQDLAETEEVQAMPCYPNAGAIRVIGDTVVVKFQNTAE